MLKQCVFCVNGKFDINQLTSMYLTYKHKILIVCTLTSSRRFSQRPHGLSSKISLSSSESSPLSRGDLRSLSIFLPPDITIQKYLSKNIIQTYNYTMKLFTSVSTQHSIYFQNTLFLVIIISKVARLVVITVPLQFITNSLKYYLLTNADP